MISENCILYNILKTHIYNTNNSVKLIMLTGTPIFDNPNEVALTLNILRLKILLPNNKKFNKTFLQKIKSKKYI